MSHQSQQLLRDSWLTSASAPSPPITSTSSSASLRNFGGKNRTDGNQEKEKEIIHSGHFMVSHFEAEAQEDEDAELPEPDESCDTIVELNRCTDVALLPSNQISHNVVASHPKTSNNAVIDISLAKLFKCMNLAYRCVFLWLQCRTLLHSVAALITHILSSIDCKSFFCCQHSFFASSAHRKEQVIAPFFLSVSKSVTVLHFAHHL